MKIPIHEVRIVKAGPERIVDVEPLWKTLHVYYQDSGTRFPLRSLDEAWTLGRLKQEKWLSEVGSFMLLAEYREKPVGYAIIHLEEGRMMWKTPERVAFLEVLSVLPEARGMGIGTALMNAVYEELRLSNIGELALSVLCTNADTLRFYERCGLVPKLIEMHQSIPQKL